MTTQLRSLSWHHARVCTSLSVVFLATACGGYSLSDEDGAVSGGNESVYTDEGQSESAGGSAEEGSAGEVQMGGSSSVFDEAPLRRDAVESQAIEELEEDDSPYRDERGLSGLTTSEPASGTQAGEGDDSTDGFDVSQGTTNEPAASANEPAEDTDPMASADPAASANEPAASADPAPTTNEPAADTDPAPVDNTFTPYQPPGGIVNVGVVDLHGTVHMWNGPDSVMVIPECGSKNPYIFTMRFEYDNGEIDTSTKELFPGPDANPLRGWFFGPWGFELPVPVRVSWDDGADYMVCFL